MVKVCERLWFVLAVAVCSIGLVSAALYHASLPEKPAEFKDIEGCYVKETNSVVPYGEMVYPIGVCVRIECSTTYIHYATCGIVRSDDPRCHVTKQNLSLPYPACCPKFKCDSSSSGVLLP